MIRYLYSICFLAVGTGLPVMANSKGSYLPAPQFTAKAPSKDLLPPPAAPLAKEDAHKITKISKVTLTADVSRGTNTPVVATTPSKPDHSVSKSTVLPQTTKTASSHSPAQPAIVIRNSTIVTAGSGALPVRTSTGPLLTDSDSDNTRLARVTAYWAGEGDYYTGRCISATGVRLHDGHCAVDPTIIPYGSVVQIAGVGKFLAVDTGSAVISRTAAREGGQTYAERHAIVVDVFFEDRSEGERFAAGAAKYVAITWWRPTAMDDAAKAARSFFAEENWIKIQGKQL